MVYTRKFSEFPPGTLDQAVGLEGATNTRGPGGGGGAALTRTFTQSTAVVPALYLGAAVRVDVATMLWNCTLATTEAGAEYYGFIVAISGDTYTVQFAGPADKTIPAFSALLPGTPYYLSDTIAGGITATPPSTLSTINLPVIKVMEDGTPLIIMSRGFVNSGSSGGGGGGGSNTNVATVTQPGNTFALGDILYISADNTFAKANAYSSFEAAQGEWVVTGIISMNNTFTIQQGGQIAGLILTDEDGMGIVSGMQYYLSSTMGNEGKVTPNEPVGTGLWSKPVYIQQILSSNTGWMLDQRPTPAAAATPPYIVATGGTITTNGNRKIHTFNVNDNFTITSGSGTVDYLIVAGGGGGASNASTITAPGAGGGAGGLTSGTTGTLTVGVFPVVVGAGGAGGTAGTYNRGSNGGNSSFNGVTTTGGGGGGGAGGISPNGLSGGSGGGASCFSGPLPGTPGTGTAGQGNNGGTPIGGYSGAAGGGGAGGPGLANTVAGGGSTNGGAGGPGSPSAITGVVVNYAGGGGAGAFAAPGAGGAGGAGGGGTGGTNVAAPTNGTANTGGGGGGAGDMNVAGGNGGSGVVILSYQYMA